MNDPQAEGHMANNIVIINHVAPGEAPYDVPDGWRFELTPPWQRIPKCWQ
jgi:hypothetical protein